MKGLVFRCFLVCGLVGSPLIAMGQTTPRKKSDPSQLVPKVQEPQSDAPANIPNYTGKTEAEVVAEKGKPVSKSSTPKISIYRWPDMEITFENGLAVKTRGRNSQQEQQARDHSAAAAKQAAQRKAVIEKKNARDRQINEQALANSQAEYDRQVALEKAQKEEKENQERYAKYAEKDRLDAAIEHQKKIQAQADGRRWEKSANEGKPTKR